MISNNIHNSRIIAVFISLIFMLPAYAQLQDQRTNFSMGVNGGLNFSKIDFNPRIGQNQLQGKSFGVTARYISERYFKMICGLQIEANFSERGWDEKIEDGSNNTYSHRLNYLEVPFLAHLAFGKDKGHGVRAIINLGPQFSYLLSDNQMKSDNWDTSNRTNGIVAQYDTPIVHKFEYGIVGGVGVELRTGIGNFLLEGRYYFGLSDILGNTKKDYFGRSANLYTGVRAAYLFDITR